VSVRFLIRQLLLSGGSVARSLLCNRPTLAITVLNRMLAEHEATVGDKLQVIVENVTLIPVTVVRCLLSCVSLSAHEVY
jgi:hypothetical protein